MDDFTLCGLEVDRLFRVPTSHLLINDADAKVIEAFPLRTFGQLSHAQDYAVYYLLTFGLEMFRCRHQLKEVVLVVIDQQVIEFRGEGFLLAVFWSLRGFFQQRKTVDPNLNAKSVDASSLEDSERDRVVLFFAILVAANSRTLLLKQVARQVQRHFPPLGISASDIRFPNHFLVQQYFHPVISGSCSGVSVFDMERDPLVGTGQLDHL